MTLDFSPLFKALSSLEIAVNRSQSAPEDNEVRDAVIQRFDYTFELSFKFLKRVLEQESAHPQQIDQLSYKDILREAIEKGLPIDFESWVVIRDQRNATSLIYNEIKAKSVYQTALEFFPQASILARALAGRSND